MSAVIENKSAAKFTYKHIGGEGLKAKQATKLERDSNKAIALARPPPLRIAGGVDVRNRVQSEC